MTIKSHGTALVLAKNSREGSNRNVFYNLAIMIDSEAGNISCTQDAYDRAEVGKENEVVFAYNEQYKSFRIIDIIPPLPGSDAAQETKDDVKSDAAQEVKDDVKPDAVQETKANESPAVKTGKR